MSNAFEPAATQVKSWDELQKLYNHVFFIMDKSKPQSQKLVGVFSTFDKAEQFREQYMKITKTWNLPQAIQIYPMALDYWLISDDDILKELRNADMKWQKRKEERPLLEPSGTKKPASRPADDNKQQDIVTDTAEMISSYN